MIDKKINATGKDTPAVSTNVPTTPESTFVGAVLACAQALLPFAFAAYGNLQAQARKALGSKFNEDTFWASGYHQNAKGVAQLDAHARRACIARFTGYSPTSGKPQFATDSIASRGFNMIAPMIRNDAIRSQKTLDTAITALGSFEQVFRHRVALGPVLTFARNVALCYDSVTKANAERAAVAGFDPKAHGEYAGIYAKIAAGKLADPTLELPTFAHFADFLREQVKLAKARKVSS